VSPSPLIALMLLAGSAVMAWAGTLMVSRMALSRHVIDTPNERSCHSVPTPRGGGVAFVAAFLVACLADAAFVQAYVTPPPVRIWAILLPLTILGLTDDFKNLAAKTRLPLHFACGVLALVLFPGVVTAFGHSYPAMVLAVAFCVVGTAASINFYNFMDGTDALVAGCFIVQSLFFTLYLGQELWLLAAFAVLGFLYWNRPPARIFMGDAGSTFLGCAAALAIIAGLDAGKSALPALAATMPLTADAAYTIVRRLLKGENIFRAHRQHIYQRLHISAGWTHGRVALAYVALTAIFALMVLFFDAAGAWTGIAIAVALIPTAERHITRMNHYQA